MFYARVSPQSGKICSEIKSAERFLIPLIVFAVVATTVLIAVVLMLVGFDDGTLLLRCELPRFGVGSMRVRRRWGDRRGNGSPFVLVLSRAFGQRRQEARSAATKILRLLACLIVAPPTGYDEPGFLSCPYQGSSLVRTGEQFPPQSRRRPETQSRSCRCTSGSERRTTPCRTGRHIQRGGQCADMP